MKPGIVLGVWLLMGPLLAGCSSMPPLSEQEQHIRHNELVLKRLTPRAFVGVWGMPAYQRVEFMQFFGMKDGSLMPRSRLAIGEVPRGWDADVETGEALFLAYPDRGWLVVFLDERLVYKEALSGAQLHAIGRGWQYEDKFKTKLETAPSR